MASPRLLKYAELVAGGMDAKNAAIEAGYAETTAATASVRLTPQAIKHGLLPDPEKRREAVEEYEAILAEALPEVALALVGKAKQGNLAAIQQMLDRFFGRPAQGFQVDATVDSDETIVYKMRWPEDQ